MLALGIFFGVFVFNLVRIDSYAQGTASAAPEDAALGATVESYFAACDRKDLVALALRVQLGSLDDDGERVLCERVESIAASGEAGDLQHGSGFAVHQLRVHRDSQRARDRHQHGRARPGAGQHLR
jgi:hypothetical protein